MDRMKEDEQEPTPACDEARDAAADRPPQRAIWIASYPKSGNTWVRVFIHNLIRELRGPQEGAQDINTLHEMTLREALAPWFARRLGKSPHEATARRGRMSRPT
jgi:hypothetical protein